MIGWLPPGSLGLGGLGGIGGGRVPSPPAITTAFTAAQPPYLPPTLSPGGLPPAPPVVLVRGDDPPGPPVVLVRGDDPPGPPVLAAASAPRTAGPRSSTVHLPR